MKFKYNLRKQRNVANLSQEELANKMSVSRQTISKWENGDTYPSTKHIFMLAEILNCDVDNLINNKPQPTTHKSSINWLAGALATLSIIFFGFAIFTNTHSFIDTSKIAVFDQILDGSLDQAIEFFAKDGYTKTKVVGYGITDPDQTFYIKCNLNNDQNNPCSAIIYFCKNDQAYKCEYYDDPAYIPAGEYYELETA